MSVTRQALNLVEAAQARGLTLRVAGGVAVALHAPTRIGLLRSLGREVKDLDLVGLSAELPGLEQVFGELGYTRVGGQGVTLGVWHKRRIFGDPTGRLAEVDLFLDEMDFCHRLDLQQRLTLDRPTLSPSDMLLSKAQIVQTTSNDLIDLAVLLLDHSLAETAEPDAIDQAYLIRLLCHDWGFYHTVSLSLNRVRVFAHEQRPLQEHLPLLTERLYALEAALTAAPKSRSWKARALVGPRLRWYNEVGEGLRG